MDHLLKNLGGVTLKSLLENPSLLQPLPLRLDAADGNDANDDASNDVATDKEEADLEKKLKDVESDYFAPADFGAAFLGPNLWDKTYGDDDFKLEYMELDEFLSENGLPVNSADHILSKEQASPEPSQEEAAAADAAAATTINTQDKPVLQASPSTLEREPSPVQVDINFEVSPNDVALATIPGQDIYDPRTRSFTEEELKPQPMIKKSRKIYVPQEAKDDKYWDRRRKNNIAAKRSRDARRIKENQISMRAAFLEKENNALKKELMALKNENRNLKSVVKTYERKLGLQ